MDLDKPIMIEIRELNAHIVCILCAGYFIDATTITECLHTFCKSCIVKYLQTSKFCPNCNTKIHETQPLINLRSDRTLQDIVFKLVPHLSEAEEERRKHFYKSRGLDDDQNSDQKQSLAVTETFRSNGYNSDEEISLCVEPLSLSFINANLHSLQRPLQSFTRRFLRCSSRARVGHVIHLVTKLCRLPATHCVEILCAESLLSPLATLKSVFLRRWLGKGFPCLLQCVVVTAEMKNKARREAAERKLDSKRRKKAAAAAAAAASSSTAAAMSETAIDNDNVNNGNDDKVATLTTVTDNVEKKPAIADREEEGRRGEKEDPCNAATPGNAAFRRRKADPLLLHGGGDDDDDDDAHDDDSLLRRNDNRSNRPVVNGYSTSSSSRPEMANARSENAPPPPAAAAGDTTTTPPAPSISAATAGIPFKKEVDAAGDVVEKAEKEEVEEKEGKLENEEGSRGAAIIKKEIEETGSSSSRLEEEGASSRVSSSPSSSSFLSSSQPPQPPPPQMLPIVPATTSTRAIADSTCP